MIIQDKISFPSVNDFSITSLPKKFEDLTEYLFLGVNVIGCHDFFQFFNELLRWQWQKF